MPGFNFPPAVTGSALVLGALSLFGLLIRQIGPWRKQITETEERLRKELREALDMERAAHSEREKRHADARIADSRRIEAMERKLTRQQLRHNAERSLDRHRLNNITACFDATLILLEMNPDKAVEVVAKIKEMRKAQMVAEAEEKAIIRAAEIAADEVETDHDGN